MGKDHIILQIKNACEHGVISSCDLMNIALDFKKKESERLTEYVSQVIKMFKGKESVISASSNQEIKEVVDWLIENERYEDIILLKKNKVVRNKIFSEYKSSK